MKPKRESIYEGKALSLGLEQATFPDGSQETLEIIRHPGGAGTVAIDDKGNVCLIYQYRHAADGWLWEIPAGRLEGREEPLITARRELLEEAGLAAKHWQALGVILPSPGICDERITLFLAGGLSSVPVAHEPTEFIEIHWVPVSEAMAWIQTGKITDAKTIIALFMAQTELTKQPV
jgi:ADP-ribose pyrophosphatase